jgi:hypothetical protein
MAHKTDLNPTLVITFNAVIGLATRHHREGRNKVLRQQSILPSIFYSTAVFILNIFTL